MQKIYFDDRPLYLTKTLTRELAALEGSSGAVFVDVSTREEAISALVNMQDPATKLLVLTCPDPVEAMEWIKSKYLLVQAAGGYVTGPEKEVLFIFRKGRWDLPKGKLDAGETLEACALREVEEETGATGLQLKELLAITYHTYTEKQADILKETYWYHMTCAHAGLLLPQANEGILQCKWVKPRDQAAYMENTFGAIREVFKKAAEIDKG